MKIKNLVSPVLLLGIIFTLVLSPSLAAQNKEPQQRATIPPEVKSVLNEGIETRQVRSDIPFSIIKNYYLPDFPARQDLHSIFLFKVKNSDLGFTSISPAPKSPEKKEKKEQIFLRESESAPDALRAVCHIFLQFNRLENNVPGEVVKEVYLPIRFQVTSDLYEPDKEELYSTRNLLPPGNYLLSMAIASEKLEKIGTQYLEFSLPNEVSFTDRLETTPVFFLKRIRQLDNPELRASLHRGYFTYIIFQIEPNVEKIFSSGDSLEVFYFVFGSQPDESAKHSIEVTYEVLKGEETAIRYAPRTYISPLIQEALPLKQHVIIKSEEGERSEERDIEAGKYTLVLKIVDKRSGNTVEKKVDIEVR
ncbi:MAG: hypothetical protein KAU46_04150 [Candidatus Aminicenantes bacterium]|nr:hypothetical protein [Candidatus Aminicenantes bacterium]